MNIAKFLKTTFYKTPPVAAYDQRYHLHDHFASMKKQ